MTAISLAGYKAKTGSALGVSDWMLVDQARIDAFAACTEDYQFIHIDPERAKMTPFGGTIAHGFLTLSLLSAMAGQALPTIEGAKMGVNYGMNTLRFIAPVRSGKRVRGHFILNALSERSPGVLQSTIGVTVEIEGEDKPALIAEWVALAYFSQPGT